jgi:hypothetical protein
VKGISRWWAVAGSDPLWWIALPAVMVAATFGAALWLLACACDLIGKAADWLERIGGAPMHAIWLMRQQRAMRRQNAWHKKRGEREPDSSHVRALRGLSTHYDSLRPQGDE